MADYAPGTPVWVDLQTSKMDDAKAFYTKLLGWQAETVPDPAAGGYTMFMSNGKAAAALGPTFDPNQPSAWNVYVSTTDADATAQKVKDAGGKVVAQPGDVFDAVGRIDDHQEVVLAPPVDDQVVENAAVLPAEQCVLGPPRRDLGHVVCQHTLEIVGGSPAANVQTPHVAQVEDTGDGPNREVLFADRGVLLGEVPAAEVDHPPTESEVLSVEGSPLSCCQTRSRPAGR